MLLRRRSPWPPQKIFVGHSRGAPSSLGSRMIETREFEGHWWRPEDETTTLPGKLTVARGDGELRVVGNYGHVLISETASERAFDPFHLEEPTRLLGDGVGQEKITLEGRCLASAGEIATYRFPWTLVGKKFAAGEEVRFDKILVRLSDLDTWTGTSGFSIPEPGAGDPDKALWRHYDVRFDRPEPIEIELDHGEQAVIEFGVNHSGWTPVATSVTITQDTALWLRFAEPHDLVAVAERVAQLRYFFTLAVGRTVTVLSVTGYQNSYRYEHGDQEIPIKLLWGIHHNPDPPTDKRHPVLMPFTREGAASAGGIDHVLRRWFAIQDRYQPVRNLYFGVRYHPDLYSDLRFLALAQALETFHRRRGGHGRTLEQKMQAILGECPTITTKIVEASDTTRADFPTIFKDTRDYYTHYNPRKGSTAVHGLALYGLATQVEALIEMLLFRELGFSCDDIDAILARTPARYREIRNIYEQIGDEEANAPLL